MRSLADAAKLGVKELRPYRVVCLFQPSKPLSADFVTALASYVKEGGGLAIVPPVADLGGQLNAWNNAVADLLPARLAELKTAPVGKYYYWDEFDPNNSLTAPFDKWRRGANPDFAKEELRPFVNRYWRVDPVQGAGVVVGSFADGDRSAALVGAAPSATAASCCSPPRSTGDRSPPTGIGTISIPIRPSAWC